MTFLKYYFQRIIGNFSQFSAFIAHILICQSIRVQYLMKYKIVDFLAFMKGNRDVKIQNIGQ